MTLSHRVSELVRACFTGLWIESHEHQDAVIELAQLCRDENWRLASWDIDAGLSIAGNADNSAGSQDPLAAIRSLNALASPDGAALLVLKNFHRFLQSAEIVQALARQIEAGKQNRTFVIILSPVVQVPTELEKQFIVVEHPLPGREQLQEIAAGIATDDGELPNGQELEQVLDAAAGLTRFEAEGAFSLSLVRHNKLRPDVLWEQKSQMLKKSGLLTIHRGGEKFDQLGGLESLKAFCLRALRHTGGGANRPKPRGALLLGVPGSGKSAFCKGLGNETGRPTLILDVGSLMGSLVGQSEERMRQALKIVDAMQPCVCMLDEVEKALSGVASSGSTDSGVSARMFGTFLSWLNDHESDVFVICTANDVSKLPPEFSRAERFDAIFFLDLPGREQKNAIWQMYLSGYQLDRQQRRPIDDQWTGAEIKSCCRLAALLDVPLVQAAQNVVPVAITAAESVEKLRTWASGRCLSAEQPGIYRHEESSTSGPRRKVSRNPSQN